MSRTSDGLTLTRLAGMYVAHAAIYYRQVATGKPTREHMNIHAAIRPLCQRHADLLACDLTKQHVLDHRERLIAADLTRSYINAAIGRIRRMMLWAADSKLISQEQADLIASIRPLVRRRSPARENPRVQPVDEDAFVACLKHVPPAERELLELLALTGARFGEIANLRKGDVLISRGEVWLAPRQHKTAHHDVSRAIPVPARGRAMVLRRLKAASPWLFPSGRFVGLPIGPTGLRNAIAKACDAAGVPTWTPHQIRHLVARKVRAKAGLDAASALLGHTSTRMTEHYAPVPPAAAKEGSRAAGLSLGRRLGRV